MAAQNDLQALEAVAQRVAGLIGAACESLAEKHGGDPPLFALLMFTPGEGGWSTWVSNAERESMIEALEEMTKNLRAGLDRH